MEKLNYNSSFNPELSAEQQFIMGLDTIRPKHCGEGIYGQYGCCMLSKKGCGLKWVRKEWRDYNEN